MLLTDESLKSCFQNNINALSNAFMNSSYTKQNKKLQLKRYTTINNNKKEGALVFGDIMLVGKM